jgi:hypothetical protein
MGWVRRIAQAQRRCDSCWGLIDAEEMYFLTTKGERFCIDCPPEIEHGKEHCGL